MASKAPAAVINRRGPSKTVCTIGWDRRKDKFTVGQWMRGRIYERRSDLSPDGKYMIYFAMNGRWHTAAKGSWTAISKAPYLKAVTLFPKGDCWNGGGLFTGRGRYWLNDGYGHAGMSDSHEVVRDEEFRPEGGIGGECLGVYFPRLLRDGWKALGLHDQAHVFEKPFARGWSLRKFAGYGGGEGKACYSDQHQLVHHRRDIVIPFATWEWAEVDGSRLVWADAGALYSGKASASGLCEAKSLADFNGLTFEPLAAPY